MVKIKQKFFVNNLDSLFDIAHVDELKSIKIEANRMFLQSQ